MGKIARGIQSIAQLRRKGMRRVLGVTDLFAIGYGDLGSSIYYALGIVAVFALGAMPISLGLAGLVFICTALTYAELTSMSHESGGTASFARHAFNDLISFIAGWGLLFDYIITIAISAFAVGPYLGFFWPELKTSMSLQLGFSSSLIAILFLINFLGVRQSTRMSLVLVSATLITQLVVIVIGFFWLLDLPKIWDQLQINVPNSPLSPTWPEFWKGTAMAMVAYTGIESIAQLGAEARNPAKTVPRAVFFTMTVLVLTYLGIAITGLSAISPHELGTTYIDDPLAGIVSKLPFGNKILGAWIGVFAALILFIAANAGLVGSSRLCFNMGEYYQLPRGFFRLHSRFRTPWVALAFFAVVAILIVLASRGQMLFLADLYNFGAMLAFFFAHLSLIMMRIKRPNMVRPFRVPFNISIRGRHVPLTAIIGCLATMSVWFLIVITKPHGRYIGFAWMLLGIGMYIYYRKKEKIAPVSSLEIEQIRIPGYKPLTIKRILVPTGRGETQTVQMACELAKLHDAKLTVVHVLEVPTSMPLDAKLPQRVAVGEAAIKRAEAIAREFNLKCDLRIMRSRSVLDAILELVDKERIDLLLLSNVSQTQKGLASLPEQVLKKAPCRVWVCTGK